MHKFLFSLLLLVLFLTPVFSQGNHIVVKGDTLWDLANQYYQDPWEWPKIWKANSSKIQNPDLIYPQQNFIIPGISQAIEETTQIPEQVPVTEEVAQTQEELIPQTEEVPEVVEIEEVVEVEEEEPEEIEPEEDTRVITKKTKQKQYINADSFVVTQDWEIDGRITGEKDRKLLIATGDTVYVNIGEDRIQPGSKLMVYRKVGKVKDRYRFLGFEIKRIAKLEITDKVSTKAASAKVTVSYEPLQIGDIVKIIQDE